jgi:hypothetical protein
MKSIVKLLAALAVVVAVLLSPLLLVWALNTLFPSLAIAYNFSTWLASVILLGLLQAMAKRA